MSKNNIHSVEDWVGKDNGLGIDIWNGKYSDNETYDDWLFRVSGGNKHVARLIAEKKFLFGGRILSNRGKASKKITYSNCYVVTPPDDDLDSIFEAAKKMARTFSTGGGVGLDISKLAPKGARISNASNETTGAVSFMELYSTVTGLISQGKRRGALMLSLDCTHPDLPEFINIKSDLNKITDANISVRVSDKFMNAVAANKDWELSFTRKETGEVIKKTVNAREIFHKLAENNWDYAEPGILYWDTINKWNLLSNNEEFSYAGTNPCAEEPLPAGGSCLLGSLNLDAFVKDGQFDYADFKEAVKISVRALNDVLEEGLPLHPLKEQRDSVSDWRQIGLGVFGIADMLIHMGLKYGSPRSLQECDKIGKLMIDTALYESAMLAKERGPYPKYTPDVMKTPFFSLNASTGTVVAVEKYGLRNSQLLTCAPTGSISTMLGVSGGIEPIFSFSYKRKTESLHGKETYYDVFTPIAKEWMDANSVYDINKLPDYFIKASDIDYRDRIAMQAVWQKHIDASISSTLNLPNDISVEDVEQVYMMAWNNNLKGCTIYRDGCKRSGILSESAVINDDTANPSVEDLPRGYVIKASDDLIGKKRTLQTGCGKMYVTAFADPCTGDILETYIDKGSAGGCNSFMTATSRLISLSARGGVSIVDIVDQLNSAPVCPSYFGRRLTHKDVSPGTCCSVAIGKALINMQEEFWNEVCDDSHENISESTNTEDVKERPKEKQQDKSKVVKVKVANTPVHHEYDACPECGELTLSHSGGCISCMNCGYTKCD